MPHPVDPPEDPHGVFARLSVPIRGAAVSRAVSGGLARLTVVAPHRRVDVALPEAVPVAELLPTLLRHAGDGLADQGQEHGGWVLRRSDGTLVDAGRSLGAQEVRDGEVLHLVPRREQWPELDYDDVVDAIARSARERSRSWGSTATRRLGVGTGAAALVLAVLLSLSTGPDWGPAGGMTLGLAAVALTVSAVLARAVGDAGAAVVSGVLAMAAAGCGAAVLGLRGQPLTALGPAQLVAGAAALLVVALLVLGIVSVHAQYPVAGTVVGALGVLTGLAARTDTIGRVDAAALLLALVVVLTPVVPLAAVRWGGLPMPVLPRSTEELLADRPQVPRARVAARVRRSDELLTGMLAGAGLVSVGASAVLVVDGRGSALVLVGLDAAAALLRARLFPAVRHRLPQLGAGMVTVVLLASVGLTLSAQARLLVLVPLLVLLAVLAPAAGLRFGDRAPGPLLGRVGDVLDVLVVLAVVPVACLVVGLYGYVRGLYG